VLLGIAGWKNSGKTTLIERLIPLLAARGLKVATIKHTHHAVLRGDDRTTDGARHARAGACGVIVIGPQAWELSGALQTSPPPSLQEAAALLTEADLILVEGFKTAPIAKIEVRGGLTEPSLAAHDPLILAIVADDRPIEPLKHFPRNDAAAIAAFVAEWLETAPAPHLRGPSRSQTGDGGHN
jgi:molybdopterin-guanine dinucleotide biosynthesis protein B